MSLPNNDDAAEDAEEGEGEEEDGLGVVEVAVFSSLLSDSAFAEANRLANVPIDIRLPNRGEAYRTALGVACCNGVKRESDKEKHLAV